jgi:hypothetical protein
MENFLNWIFYVSNFQILFIGKHVVIFKEVDLGAFDSRGD